MVRFERVEESGDELGIEEGRKLMKRVHAQLDEFGKLIPDLPVEIMEVTEGARDASGLADLCSLSPTLTHEEKIDLLETIDPDKRLEGQPSLRQAARSPQSDRQDQTHPRV